MKKLILVLIFTFGWSLAFAQNTCPEGEYYSGNYEQCLPNEMQCEDDEYWDEEYEQCVTEDMKEDTSSSAPSTTPAQKAVEEQKQELMRGIIPEASEKDANCDEVDFSDDSRKNSSLGLKIKCGTVGLSDMPGQITYWISFVLKLIPTLGVIMVLVAGLFYLYGAVSEGDREKAKNALVYVAVGLVVSFSAWLVVDWIQTWLTAGIG